jgi:hypothetical protein
MSVDPSLIASIVALIIAVGGIITARATASGAITEAAMKLVTPLKKRIEELENHVKAQDREIQKLRSGIPVLIKQLKDVGLQPRWFPSPAEIEESQGD